MGEVRPLERPPGGRSRGAKKVSGLAKMKGNKTTSSRKDADMPYISTFPLPRTHWTMEGRRTLERLWKKNVERGIVEEECRTWQRGLGHGRIRP